MNRTVRGICAPSPTFSSPRASKSHERKLRFDPEIDLSDRLQATIRNEAVLLHRLRIAEVALEDVPLDAALTETWGRGLRFGIASLGDGRAYWFACVLLPELQHREDTLDQVASRFRGWHAPIPHLLRVTPREALICNDIYYVGAPLDRFVRGRVAVLGDAAHAVTPDIGQGACLAIEDAVVLAASLADSADLTAGLAAYDRVRRPRTQSMARLSGRLARVLETRNPIASSLRDLFASALPTWTFLRASAGAFSWTPPARSDRDSGG